MITLDYDDGYRAGFIDAREKGEMELRALRAQVDRLLNQLVAIHACEPPQPIIIRGDLSYLPIIQGSGDKP